MRAWLVLVAMTTVAHAEPAPMVDDPAREPYMLELGARGHWDRANELVRLSDEAQRAGKPERAARYLAIACTARSTALFDATASAPECKRAAELGERLHLVDVAVQLAYSQGSEQAWHLDIPGSLATLQRGLELGKALDVSSELGFPVRAVQFTLGAILVEAGKYDLAASQLRAVAKASEAAHDAAMEGWAALWMCRLYGHLGQWPEARRACAQGRTSAVTRDDWAMRVTLEWIDAEIDDSTGHHDAALAKYETAWQLAQVRGGEVIRPTIMLGLISESLSLGKRDAAASWQARLEAYPQPATYLPQVAYHRARIATAGGDLGAAIKAYESATASPMHAVAIEAHYGLADARAKAGDTTGARVALEEAIARIEADRAAVSADQRASFIALHSLAYRSMIGVLWDEQHDRAAKRALEVAEAGRARALLDAVAMSQATGAVAPPRTADEIVARLAPDQAVIEYAVTLDRTFAIAATRAGIAIIPLPAAGGEVALAQRVSFFRQLVEEAEDEKELFVPARALYSDLLAPVIAALPGGARGIATLTLSPDGPLHALPWDALAEGDELVGERWQVSLVPSLSVLARRDAAAPAGGALVVAMPDAAGRFGPLLNASAEATTIQRRLSGVTTLVGNASTESAIATAAQRATVIHFAGHAAVDRIVPLRSSLVVAPGDGGDGTWRAEEIYRLHLPADLVVLSACETGVGATVSGEGVMSLSRAFLHAGAGATIATLWPVRDAIGPAFADALYRELANGRPVLAAAAEAKRVLRASGARPIEWAGYVVTADPASLAHVAASEVSVPARGVRWPWLAGIAAITLAAFAVLRRRPRLAVLGGIASAAGMVVMIAAGGRTTTPSLATAAHRGEAEHRVTASIVGDEVHWPVEPGVDYRATFFTADGRALAAPTSTGTAHRPVGAAWVIVEAERDGVGVAIPALIRF